VKEVTIEAESLTGVLKVPASEAPFNGKSRFVTTLVRPELAASLEKYGVTQLRQFASDDGLISRGWGRVPSSRHYKRAIALGRASAWSGIASTMRGGRTPAAARAAAAWPRISVRRR